MRMSSLFAPTLKEDPAEAELNSHRLLLRAGFIRKQAAGLYTYLPLAWRSLQKIEEIIRDEMNASGAQELQMPIMVDAALWEASGRFGAYGPELMRFSDRHGREFVLGPTHEETITDLVKDELKSYKQLPVNLYQIQDKFRDEMRPRFGLMRGRDFIMKDGYSFDANPAGMQASYDTMKDAYARICERCHIKALPVVADSGQIGGDTSVEYMALADAGEASLVYCDSCGYAADDEAAVSPLVVEALSANDEVTRVHTPNITSIAALAQFFDIAERATVKALALLDEAGSPVVCFLPGDHDLNEVKAEHLFGTYHLMDDDELKAYKLHKGFMGPVNLPDGIRIVCDTSLKSSAHWVCGANELDYHLTGVCPGRDFEPDTWADLVTVVAGDPCPHCGASLAGARGIEVSQVFQLGTKYSEAMGATFMDEDGKEKPFYMGCYGIGVSRTLAAAVEQYNDEYGIVWPVAIAPYEVALIPLDPKKEPCLSATETLFESLLEAGIETILDDRDERPGVKFADNDLMGFPYQVILGRRGLERGVVEVKTRATGERVEVLIDELVAYITKRVSAERDMA
ncbi:proline--tRNA ligase [Collinsella sp. zg1085]|nr:proline--tRNA ligase [Collinsella sp. zg1085]